MFYYTESTSSIPRGMLYIRGNDYRLSKKAQESDPTKLSALSEQFHNEIAFFLHRCPNALVVIDEAELINRSVRTPRSSVSVVSHVECSVCTFKCLLVLLSSALLLRC